MRRFSVGSPGISLPRFPALPCFASRHIPAAPSALPCTSARGGGAGQRVVEVAWGVRGVAGLRAWERLWRGVGVGGARGRGWVRDFSGNSTRLRLAAFFCRAFRQIPDALSSASMLCPRHIHAAPFGASLRFARSSGVGRRCVAAMGAPAARQGGGWSPGRGSELCPRHGVDSGFFGDLNHTASSDASLLGLRPISAAFPCFVPSAMLGRYFRRSPTLLLGWWRRAAG